MSDLVEKVGDIIAARIAACEPCDDIARAAIAAVLEHLAVNVSDEMLEAARNSNWHNVERSAISAALRAAAEGSAPAPPEVK